MELLNSGMWLAFTLLFVFNSLNTNVVLVMVFGFLAVTLSFQCLTKITDTTKMIFMWPEYVSALITGLLAFYLFAAEFTNIYNKRDLMPLWNIKKNFLIEKFCKKED